MKKIFVSACLLGYNCKYNGKNNLNENVIKLKSNYILIPFCPEEKGGLSTPRNPSEIKNDKVISNKNKDVTNEYNLGAQKALLLAQKENVCACILKEKSPSCGVHNIYNGEFNHTLISGEGITTRLLKKHFKIYNENEINLLLKEIEKETN